MRRTMIALLCLAGVAPAGVGMALAEPCPGNPDALGTSRTVVVDGNTLPFIGTLHYPTSVPLEDHEVLITFDDGPRPPYTDQILEALAHECVKATFFQVGYMIRANPQTTRRVYNEGHSIGSHSQNHLTTFSGLGAAGIEAEAGNGFAALYAALGDRRAVSTFFRAPGLAQNHYLNAYLKARSMSLWSADTHACDWCKISADEIIRRSLAMIEAKKRGVLLLHDIQPATALAIPQLLRELKKRGYRIVHAVAPGERPPSVPEPAEPDTPQVAQRGWPVPASAMTVMQPRLSAAAMNSSEKTVSDKTGRAPAAAAAAPAVERAVAPVRTEASDSVVRRSVAPARAAPARPSPNPSPAAWTLLGRS